MLPPSVTVPFLFLELFSLLRCVYCLAPGFPSPQGRFVSEPGSGPGLCRFFTLIKGMVGSTVGAAQEPSH